MKHIIYLLVFIIPSILIQPCLAQSLESFKVTPEWIANIEEIAPSETTVNTSSKKKILVFSRATGFDHWIIPHNIEVLKILAKKTGAFDVFVAYDIDNFCRKSLKQYDAVVLNNSNPSGPDRDLFSDLLRMNTSLSQKEIASEASKYQKNLEKYIAKGGGLMILHGAITVQNNSAAFSQITGGSFDYHPPQQEMHVKEVDAKHPLVQAFRGQGLTHVDEPYFFKNAYFDYNFRPLLYIEADKLTGLRKEVSRNRVYVSWIKRHGKGRVFYTSPSHNAQTFDNPDFLKFLLDGIQYVVGDLKCDDSPIGKNH